MLHIYTGNGKGKTTSAVGLAVRAAGAGMRVYFFQMMKNGSSSEVEMLKKLGITVRASHACCKFSFQMNEAERTEVFSEHSAILAEAAELIKHRNADLIVIDEFFCALSAGLLDTAPAKELLSSKNADAELVLTGRGACSPFTDIADYITEMKPLRHPYDKGIAARKGIEY